MSVDERDVRALLDAMADEVHDVAPLARPNLRKARIRRASFATALVVAVAAIGGAGALLAFGPDGLNRDALPAVSVPGWESPPVPMNGDPVAHGATTAGGEWWLTAYEKDARLCTEYQLDTGFGETNCGRARPQEISFFESPKLPASVGRVIVGWAPAETRRLRVNLSGEHQATPLYEAPSSIAFPVKFYAIAFATPDLSSLVAWQPDGSHVSTVFVESVDAKDGVFEFEQITSLSVANGSFRGKPWSLEAENPRRSCATLSYGENRAHDSATSCAFGVPDQRAVGAVKMAFRDVPDVLALFGLVSKRAQTINLSLDDGSNDAIDIIPGPKGTATNFFVRFFAVGTDETLNGRLFAFDESGEGIGGYRLCRRKLRTGDSGFCTP
jgi:hypothetical protein